MKTGRVVSIFLLVVLCLGMIMFALPTRSSVGDYDPQLDINHDGVINMRDLGSEARAFMTSGDPTVPVNITGYASSTSTNSIMVPGYGSGNVNITVDGYSRLTLDLAVSSDSNPVALSTGFTMGDSYILMDQFNLPARPTIPGEPANAFWLEPKTVGLQGKSVGYRFNVTAWINLTQASYAYQVGVEYNSTVFRVNRGGYTAGSTSQFFAGHFTVPVTITPDNINGFVAGGETLIGSDSRPAGSGSLCWFEFEIVSPSSVQEIKVSNNPNTTFALDPSLASIPTTSYESIASWQVSSNWPFETYRIYTIIAPILRIDYYNPNANAASLRINTYLTTAP